MAQEYLCIGIDIGGTNTDAILLAGKQIIATIKTNTTPDITQGVAIAINHLLQTSHLTAGEIDVVVIGTTHFVNTVLQAKGLNEVLVIRLAKPATTVIEPLADWPANLQAAVGDNCEVIGGGYEYNGKEIAPLDCERLKELASLAQAKLIKAAAITGVFANVNPAQENAAYEILNNLLPEMQISLSHKIGGLNLLTRENATILNAALSVEFKKFYEGIKSAIIDAELSQAKIFFSSNDGTLEEPRDIFPIATYGSGPSNSMRGAAALAEVTAAIVADIGGTSTDVGILKNSFPLEAGYEIKIGNAEENVTCNFSAPLTRSCALGGGSKILVDANNEIKVGPESVGYQLNKEAIIFGGKTLTVTDIAVAKGRLKLGNPAFLKTINPLIIDKADEFIHAKLIEMVDLILPFAKSSHPLPLILVGGGAYLFDQQLLLKFLAGKIARIIVPEHAGNANALGAAIAKISACYSGVFQYSDTSDCAGISREKAIEIAKQQAVKAALAKGADPHTVKLQEIEEMPINYLPGNQTRLRIKVIGENRGDK